MKLLYLIFLLFFFCSFNGLSQDAQHPLAIPDSCLFVPNTVTPDCYSYGCQLFSPYFACKITDFKLQLYNRFGELVFESTAIEDKWDSTEAESDGVYRWIITGTMTDAGTPFSVEAIGYVTVLK